METRQLQVERQTTHVAFLLGEVQGLPDGGTQVTFILPISGEVLHFPLNVEAAEKLGKQLLAPRVALPDRAGPNGLHAV